MNSTIENETLVISLEGRIDTTNAPQIESEINNLLSAHAGLTPIFDAKNLSYISSAGLRVLMKVAKTTGKKIIVRDVSSEVYEIFETTGFTTILDVQKALRTLSTEGATLIGEGANGQVYRIGDDQILKVYRPNIPLAEVQAEREAAKKAFLLGVPCAIAFDTVRCGEGYGNVFELIDADSLAGRIKKNPELLPSYAERSAKLLKQIHSIEVPANTLQRADTYLYKNIDSLVDVFTAEEIAKIRSAFDSLPKQSFFVHNDYHAKNIMEAGGELILIDLGDSGYGNPLIDLIHCEMIYNGLMKGKPDDEFNPYIGLTAGQMREFWKIFLPTYLETNDEAKIEPFQKKLSLYGNLMHILTALNHPKMPPEFKERYIQKMRENILPELEGENLCWE